jgi:hypothetical protein
MTSRPVTMLHTQLSNATTHQSQSSHNDLKGWFSKLPTEMFMNPFYGISKDNERAILQAVKDEEDREWDAGWREVPDRYRERRRKDKQRAKPK